jgi:hypothetical protein
MGLKAWLKRIWRRRTRPPSLERKARAVPPRRSPEGVGPFVEDLVHRLGQRFQLGDPGASGFRLQCRHAKYVFRDIECYLDPERRRVTVFYDVRLRDESSPGDAVRLVTDLYGEDLAAAGMAYVATHRRPDPGRPVVRLEFACEGGDPAALARFIDAYARGEDPFLVMDRYRDEGA